MATIPVEVANAIAALFERTADTSDTEPYRLTVNGIAVEIRGTTLEVVG